MIYQPHYTKPIIIQRNISLVNQLYNKLTLLLDQKVNIYPSKQNTYHISEVFVCR